MIIKNNLKNIKNKSSNGLEVAKFADTLTSFRPAERK